MYSSIWVEIPLTDDVLGYGEEKGCIIADINTFNGKDQVKQ